MERTYSKQLRRPKGHMSPYIMNYLHERNPWTIVWWAAAFPGIGHMMLCKYASGAILMLWEFFVNVKAHVNQAIYYSMLGEFDVAKQVIDIEWFIFYVPVYIFVLWDSYSIAIDFNKYSQLADRMDSPIMPFNIGALETHYLDYRKPWNGTIWSVFTPGLGALYANRLPLGFFMLLCFMLSAHYAHILPAIQWTFEGNFNLAKNAINPQWFLNLPSIWASAISSTYHDTYFMNQLFKTEQSRYLVDNYQPYQFHMPKNKERKSMHVISTFQQSAYLELALCDLEQKGDILRDDIFVAPLDKYSEQTPDADRAHKESASKFELAFILCMVFMLLGCIYGFIWIWGPIIWALIGGVFGATLGTVISFATKKYKWFQRDQSEVVVIVECEKHQIDIVERILWGHKALGITKTPCRRNL